VQQSNRIVGALRIVTAVTVPIDAGT